MCVKRVNIHASTDYTVAIGSGLLFCCGEMLVNVVKGTKVAIITDDIVGSLYADRVDYSLRSAGFDVCSFVFPAGEKAKNINTLANILEFLAEKELGRSDLIVALGGGVVGDSAGFAAGIYQRGICFVQLPTTLLAAVDASVGGKTAINLTAGKNLAGLFKQPAAVLCDTSTFATLNDQLFAAGAAEAIKYGVIGDVDLFSLFAAAGGRDSFSQEMIDCVVERCVVNKGKIIERDEYETGDRQLLNLGHTIGHAVEKCSGYTMLHGHAVAIGMAMIARAAEKLSFCEQPCATEIVDVLRKNSLPTATDYSADQLFQAAILDKKRSGDTINLVLPRKIGECMIKTVPIAELRQIISMGMEC